MEWRKNKPSLYPIHRGNMNETWTEWSSYLQGVPLNTRRLATPRRLLMGQIRPIFQISIFSRSCLGLRLTQWKIEEKINKKYIEIVINVELKRKTIVMEWRLFWVVGATRVGLRSRGYSWEKRSRGNFYWCRIRVQQKKTKGIAE